MIENYGFKFHEVLDPIKTEYTVYFQLRDKKLPIDYVALPIAYNINKLGLKNTQRIIDEIEKRHSHPKFYVCQHIQVKNLNFYDNLIFTPHTEQNDKFLFVPHYNPIFNQKITTKNITDRKYKMSFMGDFRSHQTRQLMKQLNSNDVYIKDTGNWFFYKNEQEQEKLKKEYIDILLDTKLSLCPRGTGPSTLRLFESMSIGAVPIIFNDLKLPEYVNKLIYKIDLNNNKTLNIDLNDVKDKSEKLIEFYWDNLSNDNLSKSIVDTINKL